MKPRILESFYAALFALILIVPIIVPTASCSGTINSRPGQAVIDCLGADQAQLINLATELRPLMFGDKPDWSGLYNKAKQNGKLLGGCVLSELVQDYLSAKTATPVDSTWAARGVLEQFRTEVAGGATFHTKAGDL